MSVKSYGLRSKKIPDGCGENNLRQPVHSHPFVKWFDLSQARNTESLEERVEEKPYHLPDKIVVDQLSFPAVRKVCIQFVHTLESMVLDVVALKCYGAWEDLRQVRHHARQFIGHGIFKDQFVGGFVNHHEQRVVGKGTYKIGQYEY